MADEIKQTLPQKLCAEYSCECVVVYIFYGFCFLFKRNENRVYGRAVVGVTVEKKEFRHVVAYSTHICNAVYVHQLQLTFYLSELPITRTSWFFFSLTAVDSSKFMLTSTYILLLLYIYTFVHAYNNNERYQKWFFSGGFAQSILLVSRKTFNMLSETTAAEHETA